MRVLVGLLGLALLLVLVAFGLVIGLGMLLFAGARRLFRATRRPAAPPADVIEGEFTRVRDPHPPLHLRDEGRPRGRGLSQPRRGDALT